MLINSKCSVPVIFWGQVIRGSVSDRFVFWLALLRKDNNVTHPVGTLLLFLIMSNKP